MKEKTPEKKKVLFIIEMCVLFLFLSFCIFSIVAQFTPALAEQEFSVWIRDNVWNHLIH